MKETKSPLDYHNNNCFKQDPLVDAFNFLVILLLVERLSRKQNICILFLLENLSQPDSSFMPCWHRRKGSASLFQ